MEFDINLILVPITLVLLVAYLADKLWLKQHKIVKQNSRLADAAQTAFNDSKKALEASLKSHYGISDADRFTPSDSTPPDVLALYENFATARRKLAETKSQLSGQKEFFLVNWAYEFLPILAFLVIVRSFIIEPFNIPSSSMVPSLYTGDFIAVNKAAYGLRLPIIHIKILDTGSPKHGDVVVFRYPENPKRYYIKRVIGLPNDTVSYADGVLSINGKAVETQKTAFVMDNTLLTGLISEEEVRGASPEERAELGKKEESFAHYYTEQLGEHRYTVRYLADVNSAQYGSFLKENQALSNNGGAWQIKVPDGQYFVMGDNRDKSGDSRFWGFVPESHLAGKATYIWMHKEAGLKAPSFSRAGKID